MTCMICVSFYLTLAQLYFLKHIDQCAENAFYKSAIILTPIKLYTTSISYITLQVGYHCYYMMWRQSVNNNDIL